MMGGLGVLCVGLWQERSRELRRDQEKMAGGTGREGRGYERLGVMEVHTAERKMGRAEREEVGILWRLPALLGSLPGHMLAQVGYVSQQSPREGM